MNTIYLKFTNGRDIKRSHSSPSRGYFVKRLVSDVTQQTKDTIFSVSSPIYTKQELFDKYSEYGSPSEITELNELEAYLLGKTLRPDEAEPIYTFDGTISMDETKAKRIKNDSFDLRTRELIDQGVMWPDQDGDLMSLSSNAQKWAIAKRILYDNGSIQDTDDDFNKFTKDNTKKVPIPPAQIPAFTDLVNSTIDGHIASGELLKDQVNALGDDLQAISNIKDTR